MERLKGLKLLCTSCLLLCFCLEGRSQDIPMIKLRDSARLFGKGSISNGDFIFNTTFAPDGNTMYFSKATMNWAYITIFYSTKKGDQWSEPQPVPFSGVYRDTDPFVSKDGSRLYFCSDRPADGTPFKDYQYNLFYVNLKGNKVVSEPAKLDLPLPAGMHVLYPSFADNGDLYFCASDTANDSDIYGCAFVNGAYQAPVPLSFNDKHLVDMDAVVARDESFIIFTSVNRKGAGFIDLWVSFRKGKVWGTPINMGNKINTAGRDAAPGLSPDNKKLYFSANREAISTRPVYKDGKVTTEAVNGLFHSPGNGMPQIYEIDISDLPGQGG
jgi:Tol biopolymer transport system component